MTHLRGSSTLATVRVGLNRAFDCAIIIIWKLALSQIADCLLSILAQLSPSITIIVRLIIASSIIMTVRVGATGILPILLELQFDFSPEIICDFQLEIFFNFFL